MIEITIDLSGKDSVFLTNCQRYVGGLMDLDIYKNPPPGLPTVQDLGGGLESYKGWYEAAFNYDRLAIKKRSEARKNLTDKFQKVRHYLQAVATEADLHALLEAGFKVVPPRHRKTQTTKTND